MKEQEQIYRQYGNAVYRYLLSLTGNVNEAEELTQETFYQAIKQFHKYDGSCKILTWLCAIGKNQYFALRRKQRREVELTPDIPLQGSVEEDAIRSAQHLSVVQAVHSLDEPMREVLYLRLFGDLSFREIGLILGRTENWARVTFHRGKERIRKELEDNEK